MQEQPGSVDIMNDRSVRQSALEFQESFEVSEMGIERACRFLGNNQASVVAQPGLGNSDEIVGGRFGMPVLSEGLSIPRPALPGPEHFFQFYLAHRREFHNSDDVDEKGSISSHTIGGIALPQQMS